MLEVFRELRRALVELVIDDREDSDADHRIGDWINAVGLVAISVHATPAGRSPREADGLAVRAARQSWSSSAPSGSPDAQNGQDGA
jgi:hypothetical protein